MLYVQTTEEDSNVSTLNPSTDNQISEGLSLAQIIYITIGAVGLTGNGLTIIVLCSSKTLRNKATNMFLINQSIIDTMSSVFLVSHSSVEYNSTGLSGIGGDIVCRLWYSKVFMWSAFLVSTYNLLALTIERYFQVIHPITHKTSFGKQQILIAMAMAWVFGVCYQFLMVLPTSGLLNGVCVYLKIWPPGKVNVFVGVLTAFVKYIAPLVIMIYAYGKMIRAIRSKVHPNRPDGLGVHLETNKARENNMQRVSRNILKTLVLVTICFVVCWTGNQVIFLLYNLGVKIDFNGFFYNMTVYLAFLNCCTNPFVYVLQYQQFQQQMKRLFCRRKDMKVLGQSAMSAQSTAT